jgi:LytS/YehU family sensor histidine kinase
VLAVRRRRAAELDALRSQVLAREAKLRSLQQQLNPHFLFNCLNSLRGMIDEDRARAQQMVTRLAELLRASLRQDACEAIPLEEELTTVNAYLELESVRLEERLRIRREIAPEARDALVPPMLVQGLVENALKHGIAQLPEGGELLLRIYRVGEMLRVEVGNTGRLRTDRGGGIGLANARERLRLLHGERAMVELSEEPQGWVQATVALPFQQAEAACAR